MLAAAPRGQVAEEPGAVADGSRWPHVGKKDAVFPDFFQDVLLQRREQPGYTSDRSRVEEEFDNITDFRGSGLCIQRSKRSPSTPGATGGLVATASPGQYQPHSARPSPRTRRARKEILRRVPAGRRPKEAAQLSWSECESLLQSCACEPPAIQT